MGCVAEQLYQYSGNNPFTDSQGRNFSDSKIQKEFCPISKFWSLFNDHHEILIGTRGSGKTFLLKMMRRSMLSKIDTPQAHQIIEDGEYFAFYVPMHMETVTALLDEQIDDKRKIVLFKYVFNSLLAESIIEEICYYLQSIESIQERYLIDGQYARKIANVWYPTHDNSSIMDLSDLGIRVRSELYNFDYIAGDLQSIAVSFQREIATPLLAIQPLLNQILKIENEPAWIICVDEAEFIPEIFQKCMNSFMRSNTNRIVLKVATLPYYWRTLDTLDPNIVLSSENDFNYQILDMDGDSKDFKALTDKLCAHRIKNRVDMNLDIETLEDFLGKVGNDNRIDYYRVIMGDKKASSEQVVADIVASFSEQRKEGAKKYPNQEKTIHQKFAPILYVREVYQWLHKQGHGNLVPGWYAGADVVRKISQGNPRLFIRLMSSMFSRATSSHFSSKIQHQVIVKFANEFCDASKAIEMDGPEVYEKLADAGEYLHKKVHDGAIVSVGCSFKFKYQGEDSFEDWKKWIQRAVAFSKICVSDEDIIYGLKRDSVLTFSYAYAAKYWLPMRGDIPTVIPTNYKEKGWVSGQLSLFDIAEKDDVSE